MKEKNKDLEHKLSVKETELSNIIKVNKNCESDKKQLEKEINKQKDEYEDIMNEKEIEI